MLRGSYLARLCSTAALALLLGGLAWPAATASAETCAPDAPWQSLCNVEPELRRSYQLIEQVAQPAEARDRISGIVRERRVTVRWVVDDQPNHLGSYNALTNEVLVASSLRGEPDRVEASILAHELWHAYGGMQGWYRPATRAACLQDERSAFSTGLVFYHALRAASGADAGPRGVIDGWLIQLEQDWQRRGGDAGLEAVANEHLVRDGYLQRCLQYPAWQVNLPGRLSPWAVESTD